MILFSEASSANNLARDYKIVASAGEGGIITPEGEVKVKKYYSLTFIITPDPGYNILDVVVDGISQGAVTSYRFYFVTANHSISATFIANKHTITASAGEGGEIAPSGDVIVAHGSDQSFDIAANPGYDIEDVLVDGESQGPLPMYTFEEVSSDHSIDATFIKVQGVLDLTIPNESMKIGDLIDATILVHDDAGLPYTLVSGSVGGYLLEDFQRISATIYHAGFQIAEGGNSYFASSDIPVSRLVISNGELQSDPYELPIIQDSDPIDAIAPLVTRLEVRSGAVGVGDTLTLTITADGAGYSPGTGTLINGVGTASSRLIFLDLSDGMYELLYMVGTGDADVAPGMLEASIVLQDSAGNPGLPFQTIEPNMLEIYTTLPEAVLEGPAIICEGEEIQLNVFLTGRPPWSIELYDGNSTTSFTNITSSDYIITLSPEQTTTFQISSVMDVNGVENTGNGDVQLIVNERTRVEIINLATGYNVEDNAVKLEANVPGGVFSGPGVNSESGYFDPGLADTIASPHTILYTYTNDNACTSTDSTLVYILGAQGSILMPGSTVCLGDDPFTVAVFNVPGASGSFSLLNSLSQAVGGLTDHGDNTATIEPDSLGLDGYIIEYQYFDVITLYLWNEFTVEAVEQPMILNLDDITYCQNVAPFVLQSNLADVVFDGPGVSGNLDEGFTFDPSETNPGNIWINCSSSSEHGCTASTRDSIIIKFAPEAIFILSSECIPEGGELVYFDNQTNVKLSVETWVWDFGDIGSGEENHSSLADPTHHYQQPGQKIISLRATTLDGCTDLYELETIIDSKPVPDFKWMSDCFTQGAEVKFVNMTINGTATVDTIIWTFKDSDGALLGEIGSGSTTDTVAFPLVSAESFLVELYTMNRGGCSSVLTKEVVLKPTIYPGQEEYNESFDDSEGFWISRSDGQENSWVWGVPGFSGYSAPEGDNAWFTHFPSEETGYIENSWIESPCFDFTGVERPLIRMEMMRSFVPYMNGAVLQYRDAIEDGWLTLGENTPGIEWYNTDYIHNKPGGSSIGWGLDESAPDTEWVTAIHDLDQVAGKPNVAFRIAIANNGQLPESYQGFAVNKFEIAERSKLILIEHFTNNSDYTSSLADDLIDGLGMANSNDVIDLQYHLANPGFDAMNENNPAPASTRSFTYGVSSVPFSILDGGVSPYHRYDFSDLKTSPVGDHIRVLSLEMPPFDIDLRVNWLQTMVEANITVTCEADQFDENIQLYLVVFETSVTAYEGANGDTQFRNVVLDMLPTPAGKLLGDLWHKGSSDTRTSTWTYKSYVEDFNDLAVAAFVQDRSNGRILQAAVDYKDVTVEVQRPAFGIRNLYIYPNPANEFINVNLGSRTTLPGRLELMDMAGKVVLSELLPAGYQVFQLDLDHLTQGLYILRWLESGQLMGVSKILKTHLSE